MAGGTVTSEGIGGLEALRIFGEVLAPACISIDHPRFLAFVPSAPTQEATLFDLVVGAGGMFGGTWMESSGAVFAENEALRWLADLAGLPPTSGGVFVSGGSAGNLSALVAGRFRWRLDHPERLRALVEAAGLEPEEADVLTDGIALPHEAAEHMIENAVGVVGLPLGVALNFVINGRERLVPMAIEEPSVVAAASHAARLVREAGGFFAEASAPTTMMQPASS